MREINALRVCSVALRPFVPQARGFFGSVRPPRIEHQKTTLWMRLKGTLVDYHTTITLIKGHPCVVK